MRRAALVAPRLHRALARRLDAQPNPERRAGMAEVQAAAAAYRDRCCDFAGGNPARTERAATDRAACCLQFDIGRTIEIEQLLAPPPPPRWEQGRR